VDVQTIADQKVYLTNRNRVDNKNLLKLNQRDTKI